MTTSVDAFAANQVYRNSLGDPVYILGADTVLLRRPDDPRETYETRVLSYVFLDDLPKVSKGTAAVFIRSAQFATTWEYVGKG